MRTILKFEALRQKMRADNVNKEYITTMMELYKECYREAYKDGQDDLKEELDIEETENTED